jgi:hypothetical protein
VKVLKAIAEGMFWDAPCITVVSCAPHVRFGKKRSSIEMNLDKDLQQIELLLHKQFVLNLKE